ncbi:MAG: ABC transporter ATP-binding protein [Porphyromonadaceae bacterium]|nr:MAG: ABC transporter ATP-binding protein [Porphyromonadaceae bacterium]
MAIFETQNLAVGYTHGKQTTTLLSGLNLSLDSGQLVALLGQNGAGKSTLIRALTFATKPIRRQKFCCIGVDFDTITKSERARLLGLVSTERIQAGALTVSELVGLGRQPYTGFLGRLSDDDRAIVADAISSVGMSHKAESFVANLSDGERQKVMIARALAQHTPIIVLDEPTAFLDAASRIETMQLLAALAHEQGKAILLSTHDISRSLMLTDQLWVITRDRQVLTGATPEMVRNQAVEPSVRQPLHHASTPPTATTNPPLPNNPHAIANGIPKKAYPYAMI